MDDFLHAWERGETGAIHPAIVADQADGGALFSRHGPSLVSHLLDGLGDASNVVFGCAVAHDDEHLGLKLRRAEGRGSRV